MRLERALESRSEQRKLYLSENQRKYLREILKEEPSASVIFLVGSEGGWTEQEEKVILEHGYEAASLGSQILRAETAVISRVALISHFWNG